MVCELRIGFAAAAGDVFLTLPSAMSDLAMHQRVCCNFFHAVHTKEQREEEEEVRQPGKFQT